MTAVFHHDLVVAILGSGSRGNATYIGDGRHGVLVDCGLSTKQIRLRLAEIGLADAPLDAVLITHEHSDHVGAAGVLSRAVRRDTGRALPFYMSPGTRQGLPAACVPERIEPIAAGSPFRVGQLTIEPYTVPHDTADPIGFVVAAGPIRVGVVTDLGHPTRLVQQKLASCDVAVVEFNHDEEMLLDGAYPWHLKQRIRGRHGHLSNAQAGSLLEEAARAGRLRDVILGHLSEENNSPEKALGAAAQAVHHAGRRDVTLHLALQDTPLPPVRRPLPPPAHPGLFDGISTNDGLGGG